MRKTGPAIRRRRTSSPRFPRWHVAGWLGLALILSPRSAPAAGIVADGGTATSVAVGATGRQTVTLAPAVAGVSHNTYTRFDVDAAGAALNNVGINARTIVNQVTGTNPSLLSGEIAVLGARANVILANPNGITINGGAFVNTGRVALTTGQVGFDDIAAAGASGIAQRNVVLDTRTGTIVVGPQGLASALIGLDLIARRILIDGPVTNTFTSSTAQVRMMAGTSNVTLNTGLSPSDNANDWRAVNSVAAGTVTDGFAIDITAAGSVTSGRIALIATDHGLGVRSAGPMRASLGDFTLSSSGSVLFSGVTLSAATALALRAEDTVSLSAMSITAGTTATLGASASLSLRGTSVLAGGAIHLSGGQLTLEASGGARSTVASSASDVMFASTGDITNIGSLVQGQTRDGTDAASSGAVTLVAGGAILNRSLPGGTLGILFGVAGDVSLTAGSSVTNRNARILSNQSVSIVAGGDVDNLVDASGGANAGAPTSYAQRGSRFLLLSRRDTGFSVDYGALADATQLAYITAAAGNVSISGRNVSNIGGSILSNGGDVAITASQALLTQGLSTGQAAYRQSCFILCHATSTSNVQIYGGVIEAAKDLRLSAGTQITNTGGTVLAVQALDLDAPRTLAQGILGYSAYDSTHTLKSWFGNGWAAIYAADSGGVFTGGSGQVTLSGEAVIDGGAVSAPQGVSAAGGVTTVRAPSRTPMTIGTHDHLGLTTWFGL